LGGRQLRAQPINETTSVSAENSSLFLGYGDVRVITSGASQLYEKLFSVKEFMGAVEAEKNKFQQATYEDIKDNPPSNRERSEFSNTVIVLTDLPVTISNLAAMQNLKSNRKNKELIGTYKSAGQLLPAMGSAVPMIAPVNGVFWGSLMDYKNSHAVLQKCNIDLAGTLSLASIVPGFFLPENREDLCLPRSSFFENSFLSDFVEPYISADRGKRIPGMEKLPPNLYIDENDFRSKLKEEFNSLRTERIFTCDASELVLGDPANLALFCPNFRL